MKILYLHQYFNTPSMAGGTRSYEMGRRLAAWGHEVHMITTDRDGRFDSTTTWHETDEAGIHVHWTPIPYSNKMSYGQRIKAFFAFSWRAARRAVSIGGDIVFATSTPLTIALPGVYASKRLKIPMVFEVRDLWPEMPIAIGAINNSFVKYACRKLEKFAYKNSSRIIALSPGIKDGIISSGYPEEKVTVIPNSCDLELFLVDPEVSNNLRKSYSWLGKNPLVLYTGTLGIINGVSYLVHIAAEIIKTNPHVRFLVIGDGKEWDLVEQTAKKLEILNQNFFLMKSVSKKEIPVWYSCATIGTSLFIDLKEMWSNSANKFFDTLAAGKPIAINYQGWQAEMLKETGAGIVLDVNRVDYAAENLLSHITNSEWLKSASESAKKLALEFSREKLAHSFEYILKEALPKNIQKSGDTMRICMIGTGYVGLVTGACFAENGNDVWCIDTNEQKILHLQQGKIPIYEPGLEEIIKRNVDQARLHFSTNLKEGMENSLFIFIAVGTPSDDNGAADLSFVFNVAKEIGENLGTYKIIVTKSTVPVGTTLRVKEIISQQLAIRNRSDLEFDVAFCPEFLKEGSAIDDFKKPDRIVFGTENNRTAELLKELFNPFVLRDNRMISMSVPSAELTKYASNAMLATRISFMNELARFSEIVGADIDEVRIGLGTDSRIGLAFLYSGIGYGGSCFPKDVKALIQSGEEHNQPFSLLKSVEAINKEQKEWFLNKILNHFKHDLQGITFAVWGLSFKPHTDDIREAPSLHILTRLISLGASVQAYDPVASANTAAALCQFDDNIMYCDDNYESLKGADALLLLTEWPLFRGPDFKRMKELLKTPLIFDGRNQYNPDHLKTMGFQYYCIGRPQFFTEKTNCFLRERI